MGRGSKHVSAGPGDREHLGKRLGLPVSAVGGVRLSEDCHGLAENAFAPVA